MIRRRTMLQKSAAAILPVVSAPSFSQAFPTKPLRLVVGFAPGGANDLLARVYAARMQTTLGQPVVVENRPGANAIIASELVARSAPDGYTLMVASNGALTVNPAIYSKLKYEPSTDFDILGVLSFYPSVLIVSEASGITDLSTMRTLSAKRSLNHGVGSSLFNLSGEYFARQSGLRTVHVSYKGNAPVVAAVLAGEVDYAIVDVASVLPLVKGGKLRALGVTSPRRSGALPELPTIRELGLPKFELIGWTSIAAPAGLPNAVAEQLRAAIEAAGSHTDTLAQLQRLGLEAGGPADARFLRRVADERAQWTEIARSAGIRADQ